MSFRETCPRLDRENVNPDSVPTKYFFALGLESENGVRCKEALCGRKFIKRMEITFTEDIHPDPDFYYRQQFKIYHEPYLIWDKETWEAVVAACHVYRVEIDGRYGGDIILEDREKGTNYIVDFSILPEYQGRGIGKAILEQIKAVSEKLTAVTRKETLYFFLKSGFVLKRTIKNYYSAGVEGYDITFERRPNPIGPAGRKGQSPGEREMLTLRRRIAKALERESLDLWEISRLFGMVFLSRSEPA